MDTKVIEKRNLPPKIMVIADGRMRIYDFNRFMTVGRTTEDGVAEIDLQCSYVSRRHGVFGCDEFGYYYADVGSKNGTYFRDQRVAPNNKLYLTDGMVLHLYGANVRSAVDFTALIFMTEYPNNFVENSINIYNNTSEIRIGRHLQNGVTVSDASVSELHASFFAAKLGWAVIDLGSTNGVYLNGDRLSEPRYIKMGDCIRIANYYFIFLGNRILNQRPVDAVSYAALQQASQVQQVRQAPQIIQPQRVEMPNQPNSPVLQQKSNMPVQQNTGNNAPLEIHIINRSIWEKAKQRLLLEDIDICIQPGEMVLILGGSGAGKTTFMNAVMGYEKANGTIKHGRRDIYKDFAEMKYEIGFVPQQDLLRGGDIVYDTLKSSGEMKLPSTMSKEMILARVNTVLNTMGLSREKDKLVSKLSGGQRKRLSIAVEYIADPSLFFLDEPDSGLDGNMATSLMQNLKDIANEGKIVMVITHAPDRAFSLFNKVIVLAKKSSNDSGNLAFFGTPEEAKKFFETDTLEGIVGRINRPDEGGEGMADYFIEKYKRMTGRS